MLDGGRAPAASDRLRAALVSLALHAAALAVASSVTLRVPASGSVGPGPTGPARLLPPRGGSSRPPERERGPPPIAVRGAARDAARPAFVETIFAVAHRAPPQAEGRARSPPEAEDSAGGWPQAEGSACATSKAKGSGRAPPEAGFSARGPRIAEPTAASAFVEAEGDSARRAPASAGGLRWLALELELAAVPASQVRPAAPSKYCVPRAPAMPEEARQLDLSGEVRARYDVAPDGTVAGVEVDPRAEPVLAEAVRSWLRGCLFDPAVQDGRTVPGHGEQTFRFVLVDR